MIETTGNIQDTSLFVLFDLGAIDSFSSPVLVTKCKMEAVKKGHSWYVELASGSKVSMDSVVHKCQLSIGGFDTLVDLRVIPLGSYDVVLGMDWLGAHRASIDYRKKTILCQDDQGKDVEIVGIPRPISLRMISAMQMNWSFCKGCHIFCYNERARGGRTCEEDSRSSYLIGICRCLS